MTPNQATELSDTIMSIALRRDAITSDELSDMQSLARISRQAQINLETINLSISRGFKVIP